jgi:hypothetical protein
MKNKITLSKKFFQYHYSQDMGKPSSAPARIIGRGTIGWTSKYKGWKRNMQERGLTK